jgi:hypothetical protein
MAHSKSPYYIPNGDAEFAIADVKIDDHKLLNQTTLMTRNPSRGVFAPRKLYQIRGTEPSGAVMSTVSPEGLIT